MTPVAVVIPVKDGAALLAEVLAAVGREGPDELLVIDSGSRDDSVAIARAAGARVVEIEPQEFGHGRTRNLGVALTSADVVCFLTQDATPVRGWLAAYRTALAAEPRIGAAFGPHLPRSGTSPMIARELTDFFGAFSADGAVALQRSAGDDGPSPAFLSNVNAAYRREALTAAGGFRDVAYAEDQAFALDLFAAGWWKAYVPDAGVLHAHDYPWHEFMRRYFDEYRGLRATTGHVETVGARSLARRVREGVAGDRAYARAHGAGPAAAVAARSAAHHGGRAIFSALGSRADRMPGRVQRALSLEGRSDADGAPRTRPVTPHFEREPFADIAAVERDGAAPLAPPRAGLAASPTLDLAVVIPPFKTGSGGHDTIFRLLAELERTGHTCSVWLHDPRGEMTEDGPALLERIRREFHPIAGPVHRGFDAWAGADVVLATGWQTVFPVLRLDGAGARAYLVQDHEPEFQGTGAERRWAEMTYAQGLHAICASPWLADLVRERYGARASAFQLGADPAVYHPRPVPRRRDMVVVYGRAYTPRRAVPLGLLALAELHRRRPGLRLVSFGDPNPLHASFPFEHAGVATQDQLAVLYSQATAGLCLSMTNYSRVPQEMLACGLPCVDLEGYSAESVFGGDGPVELSAFSPLALADHLERLLDDHDLWRRRSESGRAFVAAHTWEAAAGEVETGLREALREREREREESATRPS